jgi:hypothetical protein
MPLLLAARAVLGSFSDPHDPDVALDTTALSTETLYRGPRYTSPIPPLPMCLSMDSMIIAPAAEAISAIFWFEYFLYTTESPPLETG